MIFEWQELGQYSITRNWTYLSFTEANLFKLKFDRLSLGSRLLIAQYEQFGADNGNFIYEAKEYLCDSNLIVFIPPLLNPSRGLALKLLTGKILTTEIEQMPLNNPGNATATATAINSFSAAPTTGLTLAANVTSSIAAKADRKYLLIVNTGNGRVFMKLDGAATTGAPNIPIEPGGNYEFNSTNLFLGAVSLISATAGSVSVIEA